MKRPLAWILTLDLLLTLTACSASYKSADATANAGSGAIAETYCETAAAAENDSLSMKDAGFSTTTADGTAALQSEKIIYTASLSMETTEFDRVTEALNAMVSQYGGYLQTSNVDGSTRYRDDGTTQVVDRYAYFSVAVPSDKLNDFLKGTGELGNVISKNLQAENITSQYSDTEARVESLNVQKERILSMMEKTDDIESLITLESRYSDILYELDSYEQSLKNWDRQISYSTVEINLQEVELYTKSAAVTRTFSQKLSDAFSDGIQSFVQFLQGVFLFVVEALPAILLLAAIALAVFLPLRAKRKKRQAKKAASDSDKTE